MPAVRAQGEGGLAAVTLAVGGMGLLQHLPVVLADVLGYFRAEGVAVTLQDHPSDSHALRAVQSGQADLCAAGYEHTLRQQTLGLQYRAFVLQARAPQMALGISTRHLAGYRDLADLQHRRVGVAALESSTQFVARLLLAKAGIADRDVQWVPVGSGTEALQALRAGRVHALCHADPLITPLEVRGELRVVADLRGPRGAQDLLGGTLPGACLFAPQAWIQRQPTAVQALTHAMVHALKWLQTAAPADLVRVVPPALLLGERSSYLAAFGRVRDTYSPQGLMPDDGPPTALKALLRVQPSLMGDIRTDLSRTYSNEWVRKSRGKFHA